MNTKGKTIFSCALLWDLVTIKTQIKPLYIFPSAVYCLVIFDYMPVTTFSWIYFFSLHTHTLGWRWELWQDKTEMKGCFVPESYFKKVTEWWGRGQCHWKKKFNVTQSPPRKKRHSSPCRATEGMPGFDQEAKQEWGGCLGHGLYWGFYRKGKTGQAKQLMIG